MERTGKRFRNHLMGLVLLAGFDACNELFNSLRLIAHHLIVRYNAEFAHFLVLLSI